MKKMKWLALMSIFVLMSCSPTFNWREFRFSDGDVVFMFPCKPQESSKDVQLGEESRQLIMAVCNVGELNFTVSQMNTSKQISNEQFIEMWQKASWYSVSGSVPNENVKVIKNNIQLHNKEIQASEIHYDKEMHVKWRWFQEGAWIYQLAVYTQKQKKEESINSQVDDMFFNSMR